ncbi:SDR family NAD(P)-dependent oxidoreductase [Olivibacter domesticus]|uniref:Short chain dehydrogenase n=1 Tax=Olivibacter domesticus TaxID=407022 RepID=A0A1H7M1K9_OLID1|nr:SDR family NAD(P)-dependent oxidoreductase [Olivibacter domesticus]SEL05150.1 short chain dehydrogenase [Olivibacter domesticus]
MLLKDKNAIIYGAGGSLGSATAKAFAQEGAHVFLTGTSIHSLERVADEIKRAGNKATVDLVDALDETSIKAHAEKVHHSQQKIDITFNAIGLQDVQNIPLIDMELEDFIRPITRAMRTQFLTAKM